MIEDCGRRGIAGIDAAHPGPRGRTKDVIHGFGEDRERPLEPPAHLATMFASTYRDTLHVRYARDEVTGYGEGFTSSQSVLASQFVAKKGTFNVSEVCSTWVA
jgi:hypothetical protein